MVEGWFREQSSHCSDTIQWLGSDTLWSLTEPGQRGRNAVGTVLPQPHPMVRLEQLVQQGRWHLGKGEVIPRTYDSYFICSGTASSDAMEVLNALVEVRALTLVNKDLTRW